MAAVRNLTHLRRELARRARVVCEDDLSQPSSLLVRGHASEGVADGRYDRRGGVRCAEWTFAKGAPWTVVAAAARPRAGAAAAAVAAAAPAAAAPHLLPQHTELWMFVDLALPGRALPWSCAHRHRSTQTRPSTSPRPTSASSRAPPPSPSSSGGSTGGFVLVALLLAAAHGACQRLRSRGYKRVPCELTSSYYGHCYS